VVFGNQDGTWLDDWRRRLDFDYMTFALIGRITMNDIMMQQDFLAWLFLVGLGAWGGAVIYFRRRRRRDRSSPVLELIGDLATSGFVAVLIGVGMRRFNVDWDLCLICAGIGGHLGARTLFVGERYILRRIGLSEEEIEAIIDAPTGIPFGGKRASSPPHNAK
jgi:hypothetical protein